MKVKDKQYYPDDYPECSVCGLPFISYEEWDERHELHEDDCDGLDCDCDEPCHDSCCPDCNLGTDVIPEISPDVLEEILRATKEAGEDE